MDLPELDAYRHVVSTSSTQVSYLDVGRGPVALFVHGLATNAYLWRNVIELLRDERRCIALDLPLHGQTPASPDQDFSLPALAGVLEDFCAALGLSGFDLVANDTGGAVSQVFAATHPERLATLTLTNCETHDNLPPEPFKPTVEQARAGTLAPAAVGMLADLETARSTVFGSLYAHPELLSDQLVHAYLDPVFGSLERARGFERLLCSLDARDLLAVEPRLRELRTPTLVVWGTGDDNFPVRWAYWLRDTLPCVTEVVELHGARLFFPDERAAELVPHLRNHWSLYSQPRRAPKAGGVTTAPASHS
jgi:pimeloyl-ACP methyl ester carboxylesterase